jgi:subtilisin family serine protease
LSEAAQGGIDAHFAWTLPGGHGDGVDIIDVEGAWRFLHDDLRENQGGVIGGIPSTKRLWRNHGTAVIGIFSGDDNGRGVKGICPKANVSGVSIFDTLLEGWGSAAAIRFAAEKLDHGDVLIIELQRPGPAVNFVQRENQFGNIPVEWWPDDLLAVQYATVRGVLVVAAGGNGRQDLDDPIYDQPPPSPHRPFPSSWRNPFRRDPAGPASIIVGAGAPPQQQGLTTRPDLCRLEFSNFGSAFDAQGWGELVTTCGFGNLPGGGGADEDFWYTGRFSGTSSAAPMVAGALACLQGILKAGGLPPLGPSAARGLLRGTGSPQQDHPSSPASRRIGSRPDLRQMIGASLPPVA